MVSISYRKDKKNKTDLWVNGIVKKVERGEYGISFFLENGKDKLAEISIIGFDSPDLANINRKTQVILDAMRKGA